MKKNGNGEKEILWIVRYENGDIGCLYGTRQAAEEYAQREAEKKGTGYFIIRDRTIRTERRNRKYNTLPEPDSSREGKPYILDILSIACMAGKDNAGFRRVRIRI